MTENERLENQIDQEIKILDRFEHPGVSEELAGKIVRSMTRQYHRAGVISFRFIYRIGIPVAAAAGLVLAFWVFQGIGTRTVSQPRGTETVSISIWSLGGEAQETGMENLFADLDFSAAATQPATTQNTDETAEEMDRYLMEVMS